MRFAASVLVTFIVSAASLLAQVPSQQSKAVSAPPHHANVYPIDSGLVDANGVWIYYESFGRGKPLFVIHGGPGASHTYLLPAMYRFARNHRVVMIDERGSGKSPRLDDPKQYTIENMADDIEAVRNAMGFGKIDLLGHSYGGALAQAYGLKYQQNLNHLVLASTFASTKELNAALGRMKEAMPAEKRARLNDLEKQGLYDKGAAWEHGRYPNDYATLAWGDGYFPYIYQRHPDGNYDPAAQNESISWGLYREMWGSHGEFVVDGNLVSVEYLDRLHELKVPTLLIMGDHDESDPAMSREMQKRIAGSKLVMLPQSGHMTFEDQPELFFKAVEDFLK